MPELTDESDIFDIPNVLRVTDSNGKYETIYNTDDDSQFYPGEREETVPKDLLSYDKKLLNKNHVRVILSFYDVNNEELQGYMELIPTHHDKQSDQITFSGEFITDDYVTIDNRLDMDRSSIVIYRGLAFTTIICTNLQI